MTFARPERSSDPDILPRMPAWVTLVSAEPPEEVAFLSGAALAHLHIVLRQGEVPETLLRERLALRAAAHSLARSGRPERASDLRDAVQFLQPDDRPGPAGEVYLAWQRAVKRPISIEALHHSLPELQPEKIAGWLEVERGGPAARAASVLQLVLEDNTRAHSAAGLLADAALAQSLGWSHLMPLLSLGLKRADLRRDGDALRLACHRAVATAAVDVVRVAGDVTRGAARLCSAASKLRARGAEEAVSLFLSRDAVAPKALTSLRSDRAARRLCDRLVELGAVRELTGRDTFRLYGL